MSKKVKIDTGIGLYSFGCILAIVISYDIRHSVLWAILHGVLSWVYVLYHVLVTHGLLKMYYN